MKTQKVSVITVVFNGKSGIEHTILSVLNQTYLSLEYIVVDGGSCDGTVDIVRKYSERIDHLISERDRGIYDAMNKGLALATGKWVCFMNCGDEFVDNEAISRVFSGNNYDEFSFVYGFTEVKYKKFCKIQKLGCLKQLEYEMPFCHQSVFSRLSYHKENKFNIKNKITADFEFFRKAFLSGQKFKFVNFSIARITPGGLSDGNRIRSYLSLWKTAGHKKFKINVYFLLKLFWEFWKNIVKNVIGVRLTNLVIKKL